jgi:REP element-mobilizing transposase RayT
MEQLMDRFKGIYRIESSRLDGWDYTSPGWYFVTICTKDMEEWFGGVADGVMKCNDVGGIIAEEWEKTKIIRHNITIDEWMVMPNHLHGIIAINWRLKKLNDVAVDKQNELAVVETPRPIVETSRRDVSTILGSRKISRHTLSPNSLGSIIGQFKSICTKRIRMMGHPNFAWQSRFHDHIIRNGHELNRIRKYIIENPIKWYLDENNSNRPVE